MKATAHYTPRRRTASRIPTPTNGARFLLAFDALGKPRVRLLGSPSLAQLAELGRLAVRIEATLRRELLSPRRERKAA